MSAEQDAGDHRRQPQRRQAHGGKVDHDDALQLGPHRGIVETGALGAGRALENYEIMRRSLPIVPE